MPDLDPATDRYLARLSTDYFLRMVSDLSGLFGGDLVLAVVFLAVNQSSVSYLALGREVKVFDGDGVVPDDLRRPVTTLSIANSLNLPRETVRRHVNRLVDQGYCLRVSGSRVIIPAEVFRRHDIVAAVEANRRNLQGLIAMVQRAELRPNTIAEQGAPESPPSSRP